MTGETTTATQRWQLSDREHYLHPFTDHHELAGKGARIITRAEGVYIWDSLGHRILDGMAGLWCVELGYGRQELIDAACEQLRELPYYNSFFQCAHPPAIQLAELLGSISPAPFEHTFFTGSGSEANDTVIKLVRRYWDLAGHPQRKYFISRKNAYHGSTVAAGTLGGMQPMHEQTGGMVNFIEHIEQPYHFGLGGELDEETFGLQQARLLEEKIEALGPDHVAAFIGEPVQGAGGVVIPPPGYWAEIQRICRKYDILLVADEVITGFGRLGEWFGSVRLGIEPDLMPFAKGVTSGYLPLGGVLVGERVGAVVTREGGEFAHGYTYSGHPAACAVALANIRILRDEGIVERVREDIEPYFSARWASLGEHPLIGEARSIGLMGALEIVRDKGSRERFAKDLHAGTRCRDRCIETGLVMRAVGDSMIVAPPLVITREQIDELVEKAWQALDLTAESLAAG
ncbi:MAG: aminotransferase class III-fold pyridoxal phosphate-dependent enzyme [Xanthomonadales bacterium]|nr:aminotransferase class III-fold pyridoxal phosphate-dependent enzyme [Xanthomonadales bacterium]NIN58543.1 aminotransferase class III-fold pyridoxal phosphate-dependent enzyme [Xanthomonadales bacterium]NIN73832.1 aminotransferase class III-fold pyridoxal phosphate-dependent enzyme [Xanthomonadales bacterium]NIO12301.1 aminotransferase class III-fold pyridoxal phosphate-dependent enzyme [Xanthomonadales bacterium]NIP10936.1 aminotransferase class III-fold pyridoxal phosphate-dependent enzyme